MNSSLQPEPVTFRSSKNIGRLDKQGNNAILLNRSRDNIEMIEYLIEIGEDPGVVNNSGDSDSSQCQ